MPEEALERSDLFPTRDVLIAVAGLCAVTLFGVLGFVWVEDMTILEALYMTVITLSTVGFSEVQPLSSEGRIFAILLILMGVSVVVTLSGRLAQGLIDLRLSRFLPRRSMNKTIQELTDHAIVCGYGRFGQMVCAELSEAGVPLVVIEKDADREHQLRRDGHLYVIGSAASDELLTFARVQHARTVAAATGDDASNVFITLATRQLNPKAEIFARGESQSALERLRFAGATRAISAYQVGAQRMAASILHPAVVDFLEVARPSFGAEVDLEQVAVATSSTLCGRSVLELEKELERLRVVGLGQEDGHVQFAPSPSHRIAPEDRLMVVGVREAVERLAVLAAGAQATT